jgi:hypothetical protein
MARGLGLLWQGVALPVANISPLWALENALGRPLQTWRPHGAGDKRIASMNSKV